MPKIGKSVDVKKRHYNMGAMLDEDKKVEILKNVFRKKNGYDLNLENPKTMNEKIMWFKLYYQDPLVTKCCDKYAVKDYVSEVVGEKYVVPTLGVWKSADEIDFDSLPEKFVLKVNWSSGYNIIVKDKSQLDIEKTKKKIKKWMEPDRNSYYQYFNWGYKHMEPVVYAEEYVEQFDGQVYDYKFFMCGGKYEFMFIATDRSNHDDLTFDYFDNEFNHIPCSYGDQVNAKTIPEKPANYEEMIEVATKLSQPFPFVRVDFYQVGDRIYLGEMTFYCGGGLKAFYPPVWDTVLGEKIPLPEKKIIDIETPAFKFKGKVLRFKLNTKTKRKKFVKKFVRKETYKTNKYLRIFGIRLPYTTHIEYVKGVGKKYINILGIEFAYKKTGRRKRIVNTNTTFKYKPNTSQYAFRAEDKITPQIKRIHCEQKGYKQLGYFPNLKNPKTFNEKIMWLALYYKNPNIAIGADKGKAKKWVADRIGEEYVVPLIGIYDDVNDIDFDSLPKQFVAKLNDGWGADKVMIVRDKSLLNIDKTKAILSSWMYPWNNYYYNNMCVTDEKMENATIIIEEFLDAGNGAAPDDIKFYCCNGEPKFALVVGDRSSKNQTRSFVDMDWNIYPVARKGKPIAKSVEKPQCLEEMKELARILSKDLPLVRVDFYEVNGKVYLGEMTFTPGMFLRFTSKEWDRKFGDFVELPKIDIEK